MSKHEQYVAIAKDGYDNLDKSSVYTGSSLEEVIDLLVSDEQVPPWKLVDLTFKNGVCMIRLEDSLQLVIFEPRL